MITEDGTLLVDETFGNRVTAFDITEDGTLANRRTWAKFGEPPSDSELGKMLSQVVVAPDGCCLDADGALWIADGLNGRVIRVRQAARSPRKSSPALAHSPACSAEPTAAPCSSAPHPTSMRKPAKTLARQAW